MNYFTKILLVQPLGKVIQFIELKTVITLAKVIYTIIAIIPSCYGINNLTTPIVRHEYILIVC